MQIVLCSDPSQSHRWIAFLADRLAAGGHDVRLRGVQGPGLPESVRQLEWLEGIVSPRRAESLMEPVAWSGLMNRMAEDNVDRRAGDRQAGAERIVVVLPSAGPALADIADATHVVTLDGVADGAVAYACLLDHDAPVIGIRSVATGETIASGRPSLETAGTLRDGLEAIYARVVSLVEAVVAGGRRGAMGGTTRVPSPVRVMPDRTAIARRGVRMLKHKAVRALYEVSCHVPHWRIGWRRVEGAGVFERGDLDGVPWQTLADPGDRFYADPFPFVHEGRHWILFEDFPHAVGKGMISAVEIGADGRVGPAMPVLEEPWHLSYPSVFSHNGQIWMIPESHQDRAIHLYRSEGFPHRWVKEATLVTGVEASDATVVQHDGRFWMFAVVRNGWGAYSDTLCIYMADALLGPWRPHPANPVLIDGAAARPAGHFIKRDGVLWRPVQDCSATYGEALGLAEVTRLDPDGYNQVVRTRLTAGAAWAGRRIHSLNRVGDLECIDGSAFSPKSRRLARRTARWTLRRDVGDAAP